MAISTHRRLRRPSAMLFLGTALCSPQVLAQSAPTGVHRKAHAELERVDGSVPFWFDAKAGKLLIEMPLFGQDIFTTCRRRTAAARWNCRSAAASWKAR